MEKFAVTSLPILSIKQLFTIVTQVGVNIENDSEKLGEDCFCKIKSWVDLRHVAIRSVSWGPCIVKQVEDHEYTLQYYDQTDPVSTI